MAALTADKQLQVKNISLKSYPVAAVVIYKGAMVCLNAAGYLTPAADTGGLSYVVGIADEKVDNSAGAAGDKNCRVLSGRAAKAVASSITQAMLGTMMYVVDDATIDDTSTNMIPAGILVEYVSATSGWIYIDAPVDEPGSVRRPFVVKALDYACLVEESGTVFAIATDAKVFTLPATVKGVAYTFVNTGADAAVLLSISPAVADAIYYITGVDNKDLLNTKITAIKGDMVSLVGDGADGWYVTAIKGTWAKEA